MTLNQFLRALLGSLLAITLVALPGCGIFDPFFVGNPDEEDDEDFEDEVEEIFKAPAEDAALDDPFVRD